MWTSFSKDDINMRFLKYILIYTNAMPMHPRDETAMDRPRDAHMGEEEDPFADYNSEREEDRRMEDGGRSGGESAEYAGNPAKEMCRHVISTEGESGSADLSVETAWRDRNRERNCTGMCSGSGSGPGEQSAVH